MGKHCYLVALGSNMRHPRHGNPRQVLAAAIRKLDHGRSKVVAVSRTVETAPLGPSRRRYANAAAVVKSRHDPADFLHKLQKIEAKFGRCRRGQAWGARVLDLDIVLWDGGAWAGSNEDGEGAADLLIPHPAFRERIFVLGPAASIAGDWRDPLTGFNLRQLRARLTKPRPVPR